MDYNTLVTRLLGINANDVARLQQVTAVIAHLNDPASLNRMSQLIQQLNDQSTRQTLTVIQDLGDVIGKLNALNTAQTPPDPLTQRERFVRRVERLAHCEGKTLPPKNPPGHPPVPEPYTERFDFVYVDFGGVGWEYDGEHFAMVWHDLPNKTELTVIPTTSQFNKSYYHEFSIGQIAGLPPRDTMLSVRKKAKISRKRLVPRGSDGAYVRGKVGSSDQAWVRELVENAIALDNFDNVKTLDYYVRNGSSVALPADFLGTYTDLRMRFKPVVDAYYDPATRQLQYRKWNESTTTHL